ncbi:MAG: spondin domain-containing protein [Longimicrobiales bacterium]
MTKRRLIVGAAVLLIGCSEAPTDPLSTPDVPEPSADYNVPDDGSRVYEVTIYNLTDGQPMTPPLMGTHKRGLRAFRPGARASEGVKEIAENGNLAPLQMAWESNPKVNEVVVGPGAVLPGASLSFTIEGDRRANRVSWVSMLICSNDGFTGLRGLRLPRKVGDYRLRYVRGYDAGTEKNTESFSDIVPPCPVLTGIDTDEMGTGMSNPDLKEGGKVRRHRGIKGRDDLIPDLHGWKGPVAKVVIKRIS